MKEDEMTDLQRGTPPPKNKQTAATEIVDLAFDNPGEWFSDTTAKDHLGSATNAYTNILRIVGQRVATVRMVDGRVYLMVHKEEQ